MRNSSLLLNSRGSGGKTQLWNHTKPELLHQLQNLGVYFSLLILQIYNKLRKKQPSPPFFSGWPLTLFPTMSGFPSKLLSANLKNMLPTNGRKAGIRCEMPSGAWRSSQRKRESEDRLKRASMRVRASAQVARAAAYSLSSRKKWGLMEAKTQEPTCSWVTFWAAGQNPPLRLRYYTSLIVGISHCISEDTA